MAQTMYSHIDKKKSKEESNLFNLYFPSVLPSIAILVKLHYHIYIMEIQCSDSHSGLSSLIPRMAV
jgi:hypothetical protein